MIDLGPQNGPQNAPKSSPRGPQDALGARLPLEVGFGAIFGPFWDPSGPRKSCSRCGAVLFLLILRHAPGNPKSPPKWSPKTTPGGPRMARNIVPNRCSNFDQISTPILTILELQNGTQNRSKIGLRAQGPPPECPSGGILNSFWPQFGPSGGSCSSFFGVHVCFFWLAARLLLVLFFSCVLSSVARLLSYQATRHRSPKR